MNHPTNRPMITARAIPAMLVNDLPQDGHARAPLAICAPQAGHGFNFDFMAAMNGTLPGA